MFLDVFGEVADPRDFTRQHPLPEILFIALAAVLCGATHCTDMVLFARARIELLRQFIPLEHGVPSHDTFSRVLAALDPAGFNAAFMRFMAAFGEQVQIDVPKGQIAVDGKALRRAYTKGRAHMPPLVVTALACETFMSLAQVTAQKGGEAEAAIEVLKLLSLKGRTVTADALHCHQRMTETIRDAGGHYVLTIKANQSKLAKQANQALDMAAANPRTRCLQSRENAHGRIEVRRAFVIPFTQTPGKKTLIGLVAVARIESTRTVNGKTTHAVRCYALSRKMSAERLLATVRSHWSVENQLHWRLDVSLFNEDKCRVRKGHAAENLAVVRHVAMNLHKKDPAKGSMKMKKMRCVFNPDHVFRLLNMQ